MKNGNSYMKKLLIEFCESCLLIKSYKGLPSLICHLSLAESRPNSISINNMKRFLIMMNQPTSDDSDDAFSLSLPRSLLLSASAFQERPWVEKIET